MPITADKIRELANRGERSTLDYKRIDYDLSTTAGQNELAKDIMAMVNALGPTAEPAYILAGIEDDGTIVGISTPPIADADMRQRLEHLLIRRPQLIYDHVVVDGLTVGVYEIRPGGRPMYPKRASGSLVHAVPLVRSGTSTVTATPDEVQGWQREDDPVRFELQRAELARVRAETQPQATISIRNMQSGPDGAYVDFVIQNTGRSGFAIERVTWRGEWLSRAELKSDTGVAFHEAGADYEPPGGDLAPPPGLIPPGDVAQIHVRFPRDQALAHLKTAGLRFGGWAGNWLAYHIEVECRTDLGGIGTFTAAARQ